MSDRGSRSSTTNALDTPSYNSVERSDGQQRLHESFLDDQRYLSQMVGEEVDKRAKRIAAIFKLKDSIEASSTKIQAHNAIMHRRVQEITEKEAREYQDLLNQGVNPHEVSRRRLVNQVAERERKQIEAKIQGKQVAILQQLEVEKVIQRRRSKLERERLAFEKRYQQEMGRSAVELRTKEYLVSRTGKEQLDPTGKLVRVFPSQETTIKDHSFGLGKNAVHSPAHRERIVAKIHAKSSHRNASATPLLLPQKIRSTNQTDAQTDDAEFLLSESPALSTPGQEICDMNHLHDSSNGSSLLPPIRPSRPNSGDHEERELSQKKGFGKPKRSVMEQRLFDLALEKQKTNIFQKQIVWGKEFKGDAFLCNPPLIWFKDFDVGKPQTVSFTVTNISNTFNHFKFLDMDDTIRDCFEIVYEKPGRMSAGTSCSIRMSFTALKTFDIETFLPAVAQTGPFQIPVKCSCKKAVPVLSQQDIFYDNVIAGESKTVTLTLANQGALPMEYFIRLYNTETTTEGDHGVDLSTNSPLTGFAEPHNAVEELAGNVNDDTIYTDAIGDMIQPDDLIPNEDQIINDVNDVISSGPLVDFESIKRQILPLSTEEYDIVQYAKSSLVYKREGSDDLIRFTKRGNVNPYSSSPVSFTFAPSEAVNLESQRLILDFTASQPDGKPCHIPSIPLSITAQALEVPIFMDEPVLDFRCCVYGKLYRHQSLVCNRSKVALKIQLRVPKLLEDCVDFHPDVGFVQAATLGTPGKFVIQVKFRPQESIWRRIERKGFGRKDTGMMMVPIQVIVPDQVIPVYFFLMARLSPGDLLMSLARLDFGSCALGHSLFHTLTLENKSRIPQRVGFVKIPPDICIEDGGNSLLPGEKNHVKIIYQPKNISSMQSKLVLRTSFNQEYVLPCIGNCVTSPILFSHSVVHVGATQLGQSQIFSLTCFNSSETTQDIEFIPPPEAAGLLRVMPLVARIESKCTLRVEFEFTPSEKIFEIDPNEQAGLSYENPSQEPDDVVQQATARLITSRSEVNHIPGIPELKSSTSQPASTEKTRPLWETGVPAEERSCHHSWTILCFRKVESSPVSALAQPLQALQVQTTAIDAKIQVSRPELHFGQVAIGQSLVLELELSNSYKSEVTFKAKALHALGSFRVINSLRPLAGFGGPSRKLKVEFRPHLPLVYQDELELQSPSVSPIRIPLRGEGINPSLLIQPSGGLVDFKDVLARNRAIQDIVLANASAFPLTFSIRVFHSTSDSAKLKQHPESEPQIVFTSIGAPAFTIVPSEGSIPAQSTLTLKAIFLPDHQKPDHYMQQFRIVVPNESEHHVVTLSGRCWENQLYVFYPQYAETTGPASASPLQLAPPVEDLFDLPPQLGLNLLSSPLSSLLSSSMLRKSVSTIMISFDDEATETASNRTIFIGSTILPMSQSEEDAGNNSSASGSAKNAATPSGSFELSLDEPSSTHGKLFAIEPMKGSLTAGQSVPVQVTYQRPSKPSSSGRGHDSHEMESSNLVVSQWIQVRVVCTLRGGFLWRPLPTVSSGAAPVAMTPAQPPGKGAQASTNAATKSAGNEPESRVVHLVLRARLDT